MNRERIGWNADQTDQTDKNGFGLKNLIFFHIESLTLLMNRRVVHVDEIGGSDPHDGLEI